MPAIVEGEPSAADSPPGPRCIMVSQVLADAGEFVTHLDAKTPQAIGLADAGQFQ
jgi:hypothetical protein